MAKLKILTTADLFSKEKKPGKKPIIVTQDLSDEAIHKAVVEPELKPIITTTDTKEKEE